MLDAHTQGKHLRYRKRRSNRKANDTKPCTMPIKTQSLLSADTSRATTSVAYAKYSIIQEKLRALHKPIKNIIIRKNKAKNAKSYLLAPAVYEPNLCRKI